MKTIKIYGASDDLVEIEGDVPGASEYDCHDETPVFEIRAGGWTAKVHCIYDGSWGFAFLPQDGDYDETPGGWLVSREFGTDSAYSETLTVTLHDDAAIVRIDRPTH